MKKYIITEEQLEQLESTGLKLSGCDWLTFEGKLTTIQLEEYKETSDLTFEVNGEYLNAYQLKHRVKDKQSMSRAVKDRFSELEGTISELVERQLNEHVNDHLDNDEDNIWEGDYNAVRSFLIDNDELYRNCKYTETVTHTITREI